MTIGFDREREAIQWCRSIIGLEGAHGFCRAVSVQDDEGFLVVVVLSNFSGRNIDLHIAARPGVKWAKPRLAKELFHVVFSYIFEKHNAARVTGLIKSQNVACRRFVEHLGFKLEGVMRKAFKDDDLAVYGFLSEEFATHPWR